MLFIALYSVSLGTKRDVCTSWWNHLPTPFQCLVKHWWISVCGQPQSTKAWGLYPLAHCVMLPDWWMAGWSLTHGESDPLAFRAVIPALFKQTGPGPIPDVWALAVALWKRDMRVGGFRWVTCKKHQLFHLLASPAVGSSFNEVEVMELVLPRLVNAHIWFSAR